MILIYVKNCVSADETNIKSNWIDVSSSECNVSKYTYLITVIRYFYVSSSVYKLHLDLHLNLHYKYRCNFNDFRH